MDEPNVLIVDGANVVGSVPDGWWRDRRGAAERLRDALALRDEGEEIVLVVEGAARGVASVPGVRVDEAPGSGDDRIVELAAACAERGGCVVVTADTGTGVRCAVRGTARRTPGDAALGPPRGGA